jgi:hypothetical protein
LVFACVSYYSLPSLFFFPWETHILTRKHAVIHVTIVEPVSARKKISQVNAPAHSLYIFKKTYFSLEKKIREKIFKVIAPAHSLHIFKKKIREKNKSK